ncbi:phage portal protein [Enterococcus lactis]|uniref:Phage portal protein n=2 Tax=Bacteria TaxID=2 RepID=A0A7W1XI82_9ENTE|nr:phage portal protein [Enterococcus lactis]MBA4547172.1 phage portal protein [Enterococcus lactis]MBH0224680.1 phage portal protein [Enterococcus lactis]MDQ0552534.1 A118 family predicted phage portal protein [Enterococcus lactis]MUP28907.1 phage portal protein [Enterococcus lactis]QPL61204.1 phage portal protein [Enterococcus lactis]
MSVFDTIMNLFRKGGAKVGMVQSLTRIIDHPKITMNEDEYERIRIDRRYFSGEFPKVKYRNSDGRIQEREYVSLNMLQVSAKRMASIVFNEQCKINVNDETTAEFVRTTLANNDFMKNFESYLESMFAMGGLAIRPYYDDISKQIKLSWAQAPTIYPLQSNSNNISNFAIASKSRRTEGDKTAYYTLLEFHEWNEKEYVVTNELYRSEELNTVGVKVPLKMLYANMSDSATFFQQEFSRPQVVYLKPAGFNNKDITSPLGLGLGSNARSTLKQINDANDQFYWEIKMGQRRVAVSSSLTKAMPDPATGVVKPFFDSDQNVFLKFTDTFGDGLGVQDLTTPIRADDYIKSINNLIKKYEMQTGFSAGTFIFSEAQGIKTATEIVSENSMTYQTRNSQTAQIERAIQELVISICELAKLNGIFKGNIPDIEDIAVDFDDGIFTDKSALLTYWATRIAAGLGTKVQALMALDGLTEEEAKKLADEINGEVIDETSTTQENIPDVDITPALNNLNSEMKGGDVNANGQTVQQVSLNGAQIQSLVSIVQQVAAGKLPRKSAIEMIVAAYPFDIEKAESILGEAGNGFKLSEDDV